MRSERLESFQDYYGRLFTQYLPEHKLNNKRIICRTITFQVTDACNLRCKYCYQINKGTHVMPFEIAKKTIDYLLEDKTDYINSKISPGVILEFIGGEPLLEIDLIDKICDYFFRKTIEKHHPWAKSHMISICSNGVLYFNPKFQDFIKKYRNRLSFSISVDGNKELHDSCRVFPDGSGSYDLAIKAAKHYHDFWGGNMETKMTLSPYNIQYTYNALKSLIDSGYSNIFANCVFEKGWETYHASEFYYQLKKLADYIIDNDIKVTISLFDKHIGGKKNIKDLDNWCGGTGFMMAVDYKGDFYPCIRYMESSLGNHIPTIKIGDVNTGISNLQCYKDNISMLNKITRRTQSTDECFYCPIGAGCAWCSAHNYQCFGTPDKRATYICIMHKARVLANVYYWNKKYKKENPNLIFKNNLPDELSLEIIDKNELNLLKQLELRN